MTPNWKPSRTARKLATLKARKDLKGQEDREKAKVRRRDRGCRFPLCGCRKAGLRGEVSHDEHKGMGGNPPGDRSSTRTMVHLCFHRHQDGAISRHKGTLKSVYLTPQGYDGPVAWLVDLGEVAGPPEWVEVAREVRPGQLEPLTPRQEQLLAQLATLEI
jgi:hypothetical protein